MFERFTERARHVVTEAQEEARLHGHVEINTGHLLLGLLREEEGVANRALELAGVTIENARAELLRFLPQGSRERVEGPRTNDNSDDQSFDPARDPLPFTEPAKKALELALREALSLGHNYIGTEHILLGLARYGEGLGMRIVFRGSATTGVALRDHVFLLLIGPAGKTDRQRRFKDLLGTLFDFGGFRDADLDMGGGGLSADLAQPLSAQQLHELADACEGMQVKAYIRLEVS